MPSISDYANPALRDFKAYQPGKPIEETARELGARADDIIKLASNENPFGPSPKAMSAMRAALECAHRYPDGGSYYLGEALSKKLGVPRDHLILGNGSNEVIEFLGHAFLRDGDEIITSEHAFVVYKLVAKVFGAKTIEAPSPDYHHHLDAILSAITPRTRLVFIANPNNPTGTLLSQAQIDGFMSRLPENVIAIFDEAYFEYVDAPPDTLSFLCAMGVTLWSCAHFPRSPAWRVCELVMASLHRSSLRFCKKRGSHLTRVVSRKRLLWGRWPTTNISVRQNA